jgi:squalene-associated FAD-dependent desaturase
MASGREVAVIGGGWAGLAAAVEAVGQGHRVTLFEMARQFGGRAREVVVDGLALDNGQHICIGAYRETLRLLRTVGVAEASVFVRTPLTLPYPDGPGLALGTGPPLLAFGAAVFRHPTWGMADKAALARKALGWWLAGFRCDPMRTVAELTAGLPERVRAELIDPLCVAALNTPAQAASASVFLRVLRDALFSGKGSADLLLPKTSLGALLPGPATRWLEAGGATLRSGERVEALARAERGWSVDGQPFEGVVLAASSREAARLARPHGPAWADRAEALAYEPIVTVYLRSEGARLPAPMLALRPDPLGGAGAPAQFVFDRGQLGGPAGLLAFVVSGAADWVERGSSATLEAVRGQALMALGPLLKGSLETVQVVTEKRATFRCTPGLSRPVMHIAPALVAAGDHVEGPYPSTLESAVRSGTAASRSLFH